MPGFSKFLLITKKQLRCHGLQKGQVRAWLVESPILATLTSKNILKFNLYIIRFVLIAKTKVLDSVNGKF